MQVGPVAMMPQQRSRYIGLDVHRATIAVAVAEEDGPPTSYGTIANDPTAVRKLMVRLGGPEVRPRVAYEAGPTGYALQRQLSRLGIDCVVVAPWLIPVRPGDKVKTDRRAALKPARLLRSGDLTAVWVPDQEQAALRNLVRRARADATVDELRARHRPSKFLLRQDCRPPVGVRHWSRRYFDLPAPLVDLAWRAQLRLHARSRQLGSRIGPQQALTAVARELAGFVWAVGHLLEEGSVAA